LTLVLLDTNAYLRLAKRIKPLLIYSALEANDDIDDGWKSAKHTAFRKIFGPKP